VKWFFDSSALVPVFYADHPHHGSSANVFLTATRQDFRAFPHRNGRFRLS
jgi:predicted nucleic acid-binding protein